MSFEDSQFVSADAVSFYVDAGIESTITAVMAGNFSMSGPAFLAAVNEASSLPDLAGDLLLQIISDLKFIGKLSGLLVFQTEIPPPVERHEAPAGFAPDGSFFSTPAGGIYAKRVYKNGGFVYQSEPVDLAVDRSLDNTGFVPGDVMQVALVAGGVVGWWGRVVIA